MRGAQVESWAGNPSDGNQPNYQTNCGTWWLQPPLKLADPGVWSSSPGYLGPMRAWSHVAVSIVGAGGRAMQDQPSASTRRLRGPPNE
jgi:hypothetical protein